MQKTIATIYFEPILIERTIYGGYYPLPAVPRGGKPALVLIVDMIQQEPLPFIAGGKWIPRMITGEEIAADVVLHAAYKGAGMTTDCGPGVWVVRDLMPEVDEQGIAVMDLIPIGAGKTQPRQRMRPATPIEAARMFSEDHDEAIARQDKYCEFLMSRGDSYAEKPEEKVLISRRMKLAVPYVGQERDWVADHKEANSKTCQFCTKSVPTASIKCPNCHEVIDYERYAREETKRNAALEPAEPKGKKEKQAA